MKEVKSNKYKVALNEVSSMEGVVIPETIKENEKHLYHVLNIESVANKSNFKFTHNVKKVCFNKESFVKGEEMLQRIGYEKIVIFHDPTLPTEEVEEVKENVLISVKDLENTIENYSVEELNALLENETRKGAIKIIQDQLSILA